MALREISIPVPNDVAIAYAHASEGDRDFEIKVFAEFIKPKSREAAVADFEAARARLSAEAIANGLTAEILDEILADES